MTSGSNPPLMVDSNLLIYSVLDDHPASPVCRAYIARQGTITLTVLTLIEIYFVLTRIYGIVETQATDAIERLLCTPIELVSVDGPDVTTTLRLCASSRLDTNDALQLHLCRQLGIHHLATDDGHLMNVAQAYGLTVENPIDEALRQQMAAWEDAHLPAKGLPRLLGRIHDWLSGRDPLAAAEFRNATGNLHRLP